MSDQAEFSAITLRKAIQTLRPMLGDTVVNGIVYDLELYGLLLPNRYELFSLEQIHTALERTFGEAASFLMRSITNALFEKKIAA
jgi:hypothetical protein